MSPPFRSFQDDFKSLLSEDDRLSNVSQASSEGFCLSLGINSSVATNRCGPISIIVIVASVNKGILGSALGHKPTQSDRHNLPLRAMPHWLLLITNEGWVPAWWKQTVVGLGSR